MSEPIAIPDNLKDCQTLVQSQAAIITSQGQQLAELGVEMEKLRKLLSFCINGHQSEKRILPADNQKWLPFESSEEFQVARAEAESQAEAIVQTYTVTRVTPKKKRDESLPKHLRRVEQIIEGSDTQKNCPTHGAREIIGYDTTETLVYNRPEIYVLVRKYPKYACPGNPGCGVTSPERPTSLVKGNRYDTSVAAAIVEYKWFHHMPIYRHQDIFAGSGWTPARSTLLNIVSQVQFVISPFIAYMTRLVQQDIGVGLDDTGCRMLLPKDPPQVIPGNAKSKRLAEKVAEARAKGDSSLQAKMWAYKGLHLARYNIFDFRVSRHRDGPDDFFRSSSRCIVQGDCFSGNLSVVIHSDGRLTLAACWGHARRKVVEATTYAKECELLLGMIQALYDIEERAKDWTWQERQALRERESTVILDVIRQWLDTTPLQDVLPKSDFADAIRYIRNHWQALNVYVHDGRIPIDNNSVEQLMKQVAMGRKAWLFVGSVEGGEQSAMMMTLVSSARRHDLDVGVYIKDVLDQLLAGCTDYHRLLPDVWKQSHPEAIREYRVEERRDKAERKQLNAARRRLAARCHRAD
ncbi:MAG: transposase [Phycisphaerales bacterium]|nr:transposase [Phycisphaerales bacterium]